MRLLLPEWHPQWGVLLAWPDADTDWAGLLDAAHATYTALIRALLDVTGGDPIATPRGGPPAE